MLRPLAWSAFSLTTLVLCGCSSSQPVTPVVVIAPSAPPSQPAVTPPPVEAPKPAAPHVEERVTTRLGGGCEEAAAYLKRCARASPPCPDADASKQPGAGAYGAMLNRGTYLTACGVPPTMAVKICAAIRDGRAIAATIVTAPGDDAIGTCIGRAVQAMRFPASPGLAITSTSFDRAELTDGG